MKPFSVGPRLMLAIAALVIAAPDATAVDCPGTMTNAAQVKLTVDFEAGKILVDPEKVTIYLHEGEGKPGRVCWVAQNLSEDQIIHLDGKEGQTDPFPHRDPRIRQPPGFAQSGRPAAGGTWQYRLWLTVEGSEDPQLVTDPEVIIDISDGG